MKKKGLPALVKLAILTLVTTFVWVGFEVFRALETKPTPAVDAAVILKLDPTLDQITLDRLVNRIYLEDSEIGDTVLRNPNANTPIQIDDFNEEIVEVEIATKSAEI